MNDKEIKLIVCRNLKLLRELHNMKEKDVAEALGMVDASKYRSWETGRSAPKYAYLCRIAVMYDCTVDFLLREHSKKEFCTDSIKDENTYNDDIYGDRYITELDINERILIMKIRQLKTSDKKKINDMVDEILPKI